MKDLRRKHGDRYHVHLMMKTAPHTPESDMERIKSWINTNLEGASVEEKTYHGQLRFSVPASRPPPQQLPHPKSADIQRDAIQSTNAKPSGVGALFTLLEAHKQELGFEYYSVSQTTLDQVFLSIVGKHNIEEENSGEAKQKKSLLKRALKTLSCGFLRT